MIKNIFLILHIISICYLIIILIECFYHILLENIGKMCGHCGKQYFKSHMIYTKKDGCKPNPIPIDEFYLNKLPSFQRKRYYLPGRV